MINDTLERRHTRFFFNTPLPLRSSSRIFHSAVFPLDADYASLTEEPHCAPDIWFQALNKHCCRAFQFMQDGRRVSSHLRLGDRPKIVIYWGEAWAFRRPWPFREPTDDPAIVKMASRRILHALTVYACS